MKSEKVARNLEEVRGLASLDAIGLKDVVSNPRHGQIFASENGCVIECVIDGNSSRAHYALYNMSGDLMATRSKNTQPLAYFLISFPYDLSEKRFFELSRRPSFLDSPKFRFSKENRLTGRQYMHP